MRGEATFFTSFCNVKNMMKMKNLKNLEPEMIIFLSWKTDIFRSLYMYIYIF